MGIKAIGVATALILWGVLSPVTLQAAQTTEQTVTLPKGTSVRKVAPSEFKFTLPNGRTIVARNLDVKAGTVGECSVYDASGRKLVGSTQCLFKRGVKAFGDPDPPPTARGKLPSSRNYVQIDDEVTWLPSSLIFKGTAVIDPAPPYKPMMRSPQLDGSDGAKQSMPYK